MKLVAYSLSGDHADSPLPASREREWMSATEAQFARHCLPMLVANAYGWTIGCPAAFTAIWDGGKSECSIRIDHDDGIKLPVHSAFGHGILTFDIPFLFRTADRHDLFVGGPINSPKHGIAALAGVVETDWTSATFSMNWLFTSPAVPVRFEQGEPVCQFFPVTRGALESVRPVVMALGADSAAEAQYNAWARSRVAFNADLEAGHVENGDWQKTYVRGRRLTESGDVPDRAHVTNLRLRKFRTEAK